MQPDAKPDAAEHGQGRMKGPCLTADIGGTNARLAMVHALGEAPRHMRQYACRDYDGFEALAAAYLAETSQDMPPLAALAVAGPVTGNRVRLTNGPWEIDGDGFARRTGLQSCILVNDFAALAMGLPWLGPDDLVRIGPERMPGPGTRLVTGPGTGLGVATLIETAGRHEVIAGEGGNVGFAPHDALESELLARFRARRDDPVSVECFLSGRGLVDLHAALAEINGRAPDGLGGPEITGRGLSEPGSEARATLMLFLGLLGSFAGDLALINGARAGVYIGGGIVPRLKPLLPESPFRARFEAKGRYGAYLAAIPTWLITASAPALTGAAAYLLDPACRD